MVSPVLFVLSSLHIPFGPFRGEEQLPFPLADTPALEDQDLARLLAAL